MEMRAVEFIRMGEIVEMENTTVKPNSGYNQRFQTVK